MHTDRIFGINPVREALKAGRAIQRLLVSEQRRQDRDLQAILREARDAGIEVRMVGRDALNREAPGAPHQGIIAIVAAHAYASLDDILRIPKERGEDPFFLVLDGVEDPRNFGAILRTAETAGIHGVIIPERRAVGLTDTVAKAAAGALEYVRVAKVVNIVSTLEELKRAGVWIFGAEAGGSTVFWKADLGGPVALVLGGEDRGLRRLVRETCDSLLALPMSGSIRSLNVSVAAGVLLYEVVRQRSERRG